MAPAAEPTAYCSECRIHYPNYMAYNAHRKRKMKEGDGHIHCGICGMDFRLRETLSRHHKQVSITKSTTFPGLSHKHPCC